MKTRIKKIILLIILSLLFIPINQVNASVTSHFNASLNSKNTIKNADSTTRQISEPPHFIYLPLVQAGDNNNVLLTLTKSEKYEIKVQPTGPYKIDDQVTVTAIGKPGYTFKGWSGDLIGKENPITLTLDRNKYVGADFDLNEVSLLISQVTGGTITANLPAPYHSGDVVTLIATPISGYSFSGWSGDLSGTTNPATLTLNSNKTISATFSQNKVDLKIIQVPGSTITANSDGPFYYGEVVTLVASTAPGYVFGGWSGDVTGSTNPMVLTMDNHKTVSAVVENVSGGIYYVSTSGNDHNPGTLSEPWRSIQKAASVLVAGETVLIRGGVYNETVIPSNSGTVGNYITYAAYPNEEVIVDGNGVNLSNPVEGLFNIKNKHYIKIQDLTIRNSKNIGVYILGSYSPRVLASNISLSNLKVLNSNNEAIKVMYGDQILIENSTTRESVSSGIGVWNSSNVIVDNNTVVNARNLPMPYGHEECITISSVSNFEVKNNEVYFENFNNYLGAAGIDVKNSSYDGSVHHNYVHSFYQDGAIYLDAWDAGKPGTGTVSLHNVDIYSNLIQHAGGVTIGSERGGTVENINIYNNIVIDSACSGILLHRTGGNGLRKNINIYNNTIFRSIGNGGAGIYIATKNIENIVIKNNIVDFGPKWVGQITSAYPDSSVISQITVDRNLTWGITECSQENPNCVELNNGTIRANPMFVNPSKLDLRLQTNSPAINAGLTIPLVGTDFVGTLRPLGPAYDLGAYEIR